MELPEVDGKAVLSLLGVTYQDKYTRIVLHPTCVEAFRGEPETSEVIAELVFDKTF